MPQWLVICDLAQLLTTRFLYPCSVMFHGGVHEKARVAGHQDKCTVILLLVVKCDQHEDIKG